MNEVEIRTILNVLTKQPAGFEAFAVTMEEPRLKKLSLTEAGENRGLKAVLKGMLLKLIKENYLSEDASYTTAENVADN